MSIPGRCDTCDEPAVGVIYTMNGPGFMCRDELDPVVQSVVSHRERYGSFTRRIEAYPGEIPCQCLCGCRRNDEETRIAPRLEIRFYWTTCFEAGHRSLVIKTS